MKEIKAYVRDFKLHDVSEVGQAVRIQTGEDGEAAVLQWPLASYGQSYIVPRWIMVDSTLPEFWDERYRAERMPWDQHGVPPALTAFLARPGTPGRVLVPGCGSAYEVRAFAEAGWDVTAIDFAPGAVVRARCVLGDLAWRVRQADFFADDVGSEFDLVYERTFLCSLPPERWPAYAERVAQLLRTGGLLAGFFFFGDEPEPPPYPLTTAGARLLFATWFDLGENEAIPPEQSLPLYAGHERWQVWRRRLAVP